MKLSLMLLVATLTMSTQAHAIVEAITILKSCVRDEMHRTPGLSQDAMIQLCAKRLFAPMKTSELESDSTTLAADLPFRAFDKNSCISSILLQRPDTPVEVASRICARSSKRASLEDKKQTAGILDKTAALQERTALLNGPSKGAE